MSTTHEASTPGRPRGFDESTVLDDVVEIFWKSGYQSTTTRDLEVHLGLSQSSIYNAFGSKSGLLETALTRYEELTAAELLDPLESSEAGLAAIDRFFVDLGSWVTSDGRRGCMLINMMAEDGGETPAIRRRTRAYRRKVRDALKGALERAAASGEIEDQSIDARADLLIALVLGLNIAARGGATPAEVQSLLSGARHQLGDWRVAS